MAIKSVLTNQTDFTGEIPATENMVGLWRFNEAAPDADTRFQDSSQRDNYLSISGWAGTSAQLIAGHLGRYFRFNTTNPTTEKTYLTATNDGSMFSDLGNRVVVAGWISPTTYTIGQTYAPILNTRQGPGQPLLYLSLYQGRPRVMLYNSAGTAILDQAETPSFTMSAGGWYYLALIIDTVAKTAQVMLGNRADGQIWVSPLRTYTGTLNPACTANVVFGMHADTYYYSGGLDDWFIETSSTKTITDLQNYFLGSLMANGANSASSVDALTVPGAVTLKKDGSNPYPASGVLTTMPVACGLSGSGRVSVSSEYTQGVTAISLVETSTSDDLIYWSQWEPLGTGGELVSPDGAWIRYRVTLTTTNPTQTPKLLDITLNDIPASPYLKLGYARPVILDHNGAWEAVLENAYDIIAIGEVNGADTVEFKLPYADSKRASLDNEKQIQIANDLYRIRTITDERETSGSGITTSVYAEAAFYDLNYSTDKAPIEFNAAPATEPITYALAGTGWQIGTVDITTLRTWQCQETNALAILRAVQQLHGGDLIFDSRNQTVSLLAFSGKDSGALFAYRKNLTGIKRVIDTRSLVTRLYAVGKDGMTFASINSGKPYVDDFTFTDEVRVSTLDCSNFTNPYQMLEFTRMRLAEYAKPRVSYVLNAMDLSVLTGYEHETWDLGDIVTVDDRDLGITIKTRIIRREYNLQEPWKTVLELSTKLRELGDSSQAADLLGQAGIVGTEIKDMVPFNHLRNSRADSGFAYWQNSGFEIDPENGVTGTASFKAVGQLGMTKSMSQTVTPANRRNYTISAQIGSDNLVKGPNGQVGIELEFLYEDGSTETRWLDLL